MTTKLKDVIKVLFHGPFDTSTVEGRSKERNRRIVLTSLTGVLSKVFAMGIPLFTVRITYNYLGEELYGLWMAVTSFFVLFQFADFGLGNGLKTKLSQVSGKKEILAVRNLISSTYFVLWVLSIIFMLIFIIMYPIINWNDLLNAETKQATALAGGVVFAVVSSKILNIPLSLVQTTQMALQEGYKSNLWQCFAYIVSLVSVYIISGFDLGPLTMIWTSSMIVVIISGLNMMVYFYIEKKEYVPKIHFIKFGIARDLLKTGFTFFILSILTTIGLSLDNFIVARTIGLSESAEYSILLRTTQMIGGVTTIISASMWAANGEAFGRGEVKWIKDNTRKMAFILFFISSTAVLGLLLISDLFFKIWIGEQFEFSIFILIGMCVMQVLISFISSYFMVLNALGIVWKQILIFAIYTSVSFILKYFLATSYGAVVVPWVGALCYLLLVIPAIYFIANKALTDYKFNSSFK